MYKIERRIREDAPSVTHDDVMTLTEASRLLGISTQAVDGYMCRGLLTTVIDEGSRTAHNNPRRLVLKAEVLKLQQERTKHAKK